VSIDRHVRHDPCVTWAYVVLGASGVAFVAGLVGLRSGRSTRAWSVVLAAAGAGIASGGLLLQEAVDAASWIVAPAGGAAISVVHGRILFAAGGPFRT
jgi:hypothetical protein